MFRGKSVSFCSCSIDVGWCKLFCCTRWAAFSLILPFILKIPCHKAAENSRRQPTLPQETAANISIYTGFSCTSSPTSSTILEKSELEAGWQRVRISCFYRADRRAAKNTALRPTETRKGSNPCMKKELRGNKGQFYILKNT